MLFNSFTFAYFMAIVLPLYWVVNHRWQNRLLLIASYVFYGSWDWRFLGLLVLSTVVDFLCGLALDYIEGPKRRKGFVALSMALNLGLLGTFKYYDFFAESLQLLVARLGYSVDLRQLKLLLPIGISFYTFQSMSYVIDVYRREVRPTRNLIEFAAFVSFFPHLVAGPIMRPTSLLPQIERKRQFDLEQFYSGCYLIFWGLTKKVAIADNLAALVNEIFGKWQTVDGGTALLGIYAFAFQIYCDFSGYTDAARGVAKLLGFELALNFNLPYFSKSPKEFWGRWHISLSTWLRDYLYIPLGGNRAAAAPRTWRAIFATTAALLVLVIVALPRSDPAADMPRWGLTIAVIGLVALALLPARNAGAVIRNLMLTMVIGGLWHGARWTFVIWGAYHGALLVAHRFLEPRLQAWVPRQPIERACWSGLRMLATFHLICLGWLFFRAESMAQAFGLLDAIVHRMALPDFWPVFLLLACAVPLMLYEFAQYASRDLDVVARTPWYVRSVLYTLCFYAFVIGGEFGGGQFIYFQF